MSSTQTTIGCVGKFLAIIGKTYEITATFNNSTKTVMHTIDWDAASILISSLTCQELDVLNVSNGDECCVFR